MKPSPAMLAIVTDAFGGRGGIAQYNRDFLGALAETGAVSSITVLPRQAHGHAALGQERVERDPPCRKRSNKCRLGPGELLIRSQPCERPCFGRSISCSVVTYLWRR